MLVEPSSATFLEYRLHRILQREVGSQRSCDEHDLFCFNFRFNGNPIRMTGFERVPLRLTKLPLGLIEWDQGVSPFLFAISG